MSLQIDLLFPISCSSLPHGFVYYVVVMNILFSIYHVVVHRCTRLCSNHMIHVSFIAIIDFHYSCCLIHGFQILLLYIMSCLFAERCNVKIILLGIIWGIIERAHKYKFCLQCNAKTSWKIHVQARNSWKDQDTLIEQLLILITQSALIQQSHHYIRIGNAHIIYIVLSHSEQLCYSAKMY